MPASLRRSTPSQESKAGVALKSAPSSSSPSPSGSDGESLVSSSTSTSSGGQLELQRISVQDLGAAEGAAQLHQGPAERSERVVRVGKEQL